MKKIKFFLIICLAWGTFVCNIYADEFFSKDIVWALEFEDNLGGAENYAYKEFRLSLDNGNMVASYEDGKPYMELQEFDAPIPSDNTEYIKIGISSENDMMLKFYFITDKETNWSEDRNFIVMPTGGNVMNEYTVNTSAIRRWDGNITRLRMDFLGENGDYATNYLRLDYIRIYGKESKSAKVTEKGIEYDFTKNSRIDGWKFDSSNSGDTEISDGLISCTSNGVKTLETCSLPGLKSNEYGSVSIKLKNNTSSSKVRLYFTNSVESAYTGYFDFDIVPYDNEIKTYFISTGKNKEWKGDINGLKFDFGNAAGTISVREICINKYPYKTIADNGEITISGKADPYETVGVQIEYYGVDTDSAVSAGDYLNAVFYTDEINSGGNGEYYFSCKIIPSDKPQRFSVILSSGDRTYYNNLSFVDDGYTERILFEYNNAVTESDGDKAAEIINEAYDFIGINSEGYIEYFSSYKNSDVFGKQLVKFKTAENLNALEDYIGKAAVFTCIKSSAKEKAVLFADKYDECIGLSKNKMYDTYNLFDNAEKAEIIDAARKNADSIEELYNEFSKETILRGISLTIGSNAVKRIIHENYSEIGIDISGESSLKYPERLYSMLAGNLYKSYEDLAKAYKTDLQDCLSREKETGSMSSGSSGGGGGSVKTTIPSNILTEKNTKAENNSNTKNNSDTEEFIDLEGFDWAKDDIITLYKRGVINGKATGIFSPADNVTRAEFVKMLVCALGYNSVADIPFKDVSAGSWYEDYIVHAYASGLIFGTPDNMFMPDEYISRQDIAVIVFRAAEQYIFMESETHFTDETEIEPYAKKAVGALHSSCIINGMPDGSFMPESFATRAQTAVIIERMLKIIKGNV